MADPILTPHSAPIRSSAARLAWVLFPLLAFAALAWWLLGTDPFRSFTNGAPPVEEVTFERTILNDEGIKVQIRAGGSNRLQIAQVQVDDAYWRFTQEPAGLLDRGATAWIALTYPWVLGEAHRIKLITSTGTTFEHEIAVAVPTPAPTPNQLWPQAIIGLLVGVVPVAVGLAFFPALRGLGPSGLRFILALTVGLLLFLVVDMTFEALELASASAAMFQGPAMVLLTAGASFLLLMAIGRWRGRPEGLALSFFIALGIGLHNFGEGLAIGAAFAAGSAGLGTFLVLGFALHNVTEGIAIAAPVLKSRPPLWAFAALVAVAGLPAVFGMWLGSLAFAPQWAALALAVGIGAIVQVVVEVVSFMRNGQETPLSALLSPPALAGVLAGIGFMYVTAAGIAV